MRTRNSLRPRGNSLLQKTHTAPRSSLTTAMLALTLAACGGRTLERTEGETHWLSTCSEGENCGDGQTCICGVCTATCERKGECADLSSRATCAAAPLTQYASDCSARVEVESICVRTSDLLLSEVDSSSTEVTLEATSSEEPEPVLDSGLPTDVAPAPNGDASAAEPPLAESVCGDGIVGQGEACEVDAEWCVDCRVKPQVAAGSGHTCALLPTGGVKCWGADDLSQLGNGDERPQVLPGDVVGLTEGVRAITSGSAYACALMMAGGVKCWGYNEYGQLGDGTENIRSAPVDVLGLDEGVAAIVAGSSSVHTCAMMNDGGVKCWGRGRGLGDGEVADRSLPTDVSGLSSAATALVVGQDTSCALLTNGAVECWGVNHDGQQGDGTTDPRLTPAGPVPGLEEGVVSIAAGDSHTCALLRSGEVWCWGRNFERQVSDTPQTRELLPVRMDELDAVSSLALGVLHSCALLTSGAVQCWGDGQGGQLGSANVEGAWSVNVEGLTEPVTSLASGQYHTCGWLNSGKLMCWGNNYDGQLGNGNKDDQFSAVEVVGIQ